MHVLFASHRYHPVPGGTERIAQLLAEAVVRRGHRATVVTQLEPGTAERETLNGVELLRLRMRPVDGVRYPAGYLRLLKRTPADVLHVQGNRIWCADFYFPFAPLFPWRQLVTGHGFYQYAIRPRAWDRWYFERYLPRALAAFDAYVCDTEYERGQLLRWGVPPDRLRRISLGADLEELRQPVGDPDVWRASWGVRAPRIALYVGGFFENKRVDRLIEAAARSPERWALVLVGRDLPDSPYNREHCLALAEKLGVEVRCPGVLSRREVVAAYQAADLVVSASDYEGFGVTLAEAMAAGRPFLAWAAGAAPEMAAAGGGVAVESVPDFADQLGRLADPSVRAAYSARGRAAAPDWSLEAMGRKYLDLYEGLAAAGARR